jgi:hypothetical protein
MREPMPFWREPGMHHLAVVESDGHRLEGWRERGLRQGRATLPKQKSPAFAGPLPVLWIRYFEFFLRRIAAPAKARPPRIRP